MTSGITIAFGFAFVGMYVVRAWRVKATPTLARAVTTFLSGCSFPVALSLIGREYWSPFAAKEVSSEMYALAGLAMGWVGVQWLLEAWRDPGGTPSQPMQARAAEVPAAEAAEPEQTTT